MLPRKLNFIKITVAPYKHCNLQLCFIRTINHFHLHLIPEHSVCIAIRSFCNTFEVIFSSRITRVWNQFSCWYCKFTCVPSRCSEKANRIRGKCRRRRIFTSCRNIRVEMCAVYRYVFWTCINKSGWVVTLETARNGKKEKKLASQCHSHYLKGYASCSVFHE